MKDFFKFWWKCIREAARGSVAFANDWQWLFGIPVISGLAGYVAAHLGKVELSTDHPILDGLLAAVGAFIITLAIAFLGRLFNAPVVIDGKQRDEINRLNQLAGIARATSFAVTIEEIPLDDADRIKPYGDGENLFRVAIKNLEVNKTLKAFVVLEEIEPSLGISPAAKLPAMGKGTNARIFNIAPSETAYALLLEREMRSQNLFMRDDEGETFVKFATSSSHEDALSIAALDIIRKDKEIGEIKSGQRHFVTLAVHAAEAISCRVRFSVTLADDGLIHLENDARKCAERVDH